MAFDKPMVVIDNGSYNIKAGFACDNHPVSIFRSVVGRPNYLKGSYGKEYYDVEIGDDAMAKIEDLELNSPVVNGRIVHWDNMERIWHHTFYKELRCAPEDRAVILACTSKTPMKENVNPVKYCHTLARAINKQRRVKCCEVFFEMLNIPALCVQPQNVLSLYGSGLTTGMCVDLGYDTACVTPVYEGGMISYAIMNTNLPSREISEYIKLSLDNRGIKTTQVIIEDIKKMCYITPDVAMPWKDNEKIYILPSGEKIDVGQEVFMASEMLFQPDAVCERKTEFLPLHEAIYTASLKCDADLRLMLYEGIVTCGGFALTPGLNKRLAIEVENLSSKPANVVHSEEPVTLAWLGGAIFANIQDARRLWVTKKQFEEFGARIVSNRFL